VPQAKRLRLSLNVGFHDIEDPRGICKDVSGLGRWGNGMLKSVLAQPMSCPTSWGWCDSPLKDRWATGETHSEGKGLGINACSYSATKRNRPNFAEVDVSEEAVRVLFLTYRHDAIEMPCSGVLSYARKAIRRASRFGGRS
jgi:hypothetical protein